MSKKTTLIKFKVAQLCKGQEWFVYYYATNPVTQKLERKRIKLNWIKSKTERRRYALVLMDDINRRLYSGWNPFEEEINPRGYQQLLEILQGFLSLKERELRMDSMRSYRSFIKIIGEWLTITGKEKITCEGFKKRDAIDFMEWAYVKRNLSSRTFNNYKLFYTTLWNWLKENEYVSINAFEKISTKTSKGKNRVLIESETRDLIKNHLEATDYNFLVISMLVFHALIRPKEISHLKPSYFDLEKQAITLPGKITKNGQNRYPTISNSLLHYLKNWDFNGAGPDEYIFSQKLKLSNQFVPGNTNIDPREFTRRWGKMRKELKLDERMQLYSLRDSGIIQLIRNGVTLEEVMKQADHSSLEVTTIYVKHANLNSSEQIKTKSSNF